MNLVEHLICVVWKGETFEKTSFRTWDIRLIIGLTLKKMLVISESTTTLESVLHNKEEK